MNEKAPYPINSSIVSEETGARYTLRPLQTRNETAVVLALVLAGFIALGLLVLLSPIGLNLIPFWVVAVSYLGVMVPLTAITLWTTNRITTREKLVNIINKQAYESEGANVVDIGELEPWLPSLKKYFPALAVDMELGNRLSDVEQTLELIDGDTWNKMGRGGQKKLLQMYEKEMAGIESLAAKTSVRYPRVEQRIRDVREGELGPLETRYKAAAPPLPERTAKGFFERLAEDLKPKERKPVPPDPRRAAIEKRRLELKMKLHKRRLERLPTRRRRVSSSVI